MQMTSLRGDYKAIIMFSKREMMKDREGTNILESKEEIGLCDGTHQNTKLAARWLIYLQIC